MLLSGMVFGRLDEKLAFVRIHPWRMTGKRLSMYSGRYLVITKNLRNFSKSSIYWLSAKECFVRSKLGLLRENLYQGKFNEALRATLDKPHHVTICGIIDFLMETLILARRAS